MALAGADAGRGGVDVQEAVAVPGFAVAAVVGAVVDVDGPVDVFAALVAGVVGAGVVVALRDDWVAV